MNGSMETVLDCVLPYIHDGDDRNSISLVSRKFYQLDCLTRNHLTVHVHYSPSPARVSMRFPFIESLTLKGLPRMDFPLISSIDITPWIRQIYVKFESLKALRISGLVVGDEDLELLARTRGKDLRSLKIYNCEGFSEKGLVHISEYCNELRTLCLENNKVDGDANGEWLRELALRNMVIETFHFGYRFDRYDVKDVTLLAKKCSNSLVSLNISPKPLSHIGDAFSHAIKLEDFDGATFDQNGDYSSFKFPPSIRGLGIVDLPVTSFSFLLPYVNQLRELDLTCINVDECCQCFLIDKCPNLEVLRTDDVCGDMGLRVIGQVCKKLRKLTHYGRVTHMGLIALVQGCNNLEYLDVTLSDISNEAIECIGTHLKNLHYFRMNFPKKDDINDLPLDNGIRAMLKGCIKLKRLHISLCDGGLTDVGLGYIGKYGHNLRYLFLSRTGESDAGLLELSKGCPKLRKLNLEKCPFSEQAIATFVFNIHSLRYIWFESGYNSAVVLTRPTFTAKALKELKQYATLAEKLYRLAVQLVADGSGVGSVNVTYYTSSRATDDLEKLYRLAIQLVADGSGVGSEKITYTSSRATDDLNTPLVNALVAKGIRINEEGVLLDRASKKPLNIIKVQIANVESRLAVAISESGKIEVEGRVKDGVPHLTKVGALDVDVSLKENIIVCRQAHQPNIIGRVGSILDEENVNISSMSFSRIAQRKQAVMVIGVDEKPSEKALKKIDEIPAVEEFVFLALVGSILDEENVNISSMSFSRIAQRKQAVMVIGVDEKPSEKALKKIDEIPAVEEFVFLAL
ncbi:hypothetical protein CTI12_AA019520 [Artemisia annua]|uniref:ACT domain-containing protein n=1 Tax=Artemisia annua TaxID=35608 RepID=A0A2U1QKE9_ARTAN|nr:hypothetical protein CTI12_AA019520 [Artemisia annua]